MPTYAYDSDDDAHDDGHGDEHDDADDQAIRPLIVLDRRQNPQRDAQQ